MATRESEIWAIRGYVVCMGIRYQHNTCITQIRPSYMGANTPTVVSVPFPIIGGICEQNN